MRSQSSPSSLSLLLAVAAAAAAACEASQLAQVTLLYRHGERTPVHTFPNDPHQEHFRPLGREQLLEAGVRQHHRLGAWLRLRYAGFLPGRFNTSSMHARSTDTDRTIMSAQANMAGLFPGQCDVTSGTLACIPVPVHTVPKAADQLLKMSSPCPAYTRSWREFKRRQTGPYQTAARRFANVAERLRLATGWPGRVGISELWKIADPIAVWRTLGLPQPGWLDAEVSAALDELRHLKFAWKFSEPALVGTRMGALAATVVGDMRARAEGRSAKVLQVYSAHDSTLSAFLSALGVFNDLQPPIAACSMVELLSSGEVRVFYQNGSLQDPQQPHALSIPFCPAPCNLSRLESQLRLRGVWAESGDAMCELAASASPQAAGWSWRHALGLLCCGQFAVIVWLAAAVLRRSPLAGACLDSQHSHGHLVDLRGAVPGPAAAGVADSNGERGKAKNC